MSTATDETSKGYAVKFLDKLEATELELAQAKEMLTSLQATYKLTLEDHEREVARLDNQIELLKSGLESEKAEKSRYLRYAVELSAQLTFIVAGASRALTIARNVEAAIDGDAKIPTTAVDGIIAENPQFFETATTQ